MLYQIRIAVSVPVTAARAHQSRQVSALNQDVCILDAGTFAKPHKYVRDQTAWLPPNDRGVRLQFVDFHER